MELILRQLLPHKDSGVSQSQVKPQLRSCVILVKSLGLSEPQSYHQVAETITG